MPNFFSSLVSGNAPKILTATPVSPVSAPSQPVSPAVIKAPSIAIAANNFFAPLMGSHSIEINNTKPPVTTPTPALTLASAIGQHETQTLYDTTNKPYAPPTPEARYNYEQPFSKAIGFYQVEPATLQTYSTRYLGRVVTPEEFKTSKQLQDQFATGRVEDLRKQGLSDSDIIKAWNVGLNGDFNSPKANDYYANVSKFLPTPTATPEITPSPTPTSTAFPPLSGGGPPKSERNYKNPLDFSGQTISQAPPKGFIKKVGDFFNKFIPGKPLEEIPNQDVPGQQVIKVPFLNRGIQIGSNGADQVLGGLLQLPEQIYNTLKDIRDIATQGKTQAPSDSKFDLKVQTAFDVLPKTFDEAKRAGFSDAGASVIAVTRGVADTILTLAPAVDVSARGVLALTGYDKPVADALYRLGLEDNFTFEGWAKQTQKAVDNLVATQDIAGARQLIDDARVIASALQDEGISQATGVTRYIQNIASKVVEPLGAEAPVRFALNGQPAESLPGYRYVPGQPAFDMGLSTKQVEKVGYGPEIPKSMVDPATKKPGPLLSEIISYKMDAAGADGRSEMASQILQAAKDHPEESQRLAQISRTELEKYIGKPIFRAGGGDGMSWTFDESVAKDFSSADRPVQEQTLTQDLIDRAIFYEGVPKNKLGFRWNDHKDISPYMFEDEILIGPPSEAHVAGRVLSNDIHQIAGAPVKDTTLPVIQPELKLTNDSRVAELKQAILSMMETLNSSPVKKLSKFTNKNGELPEVTGERGKGTFRQRGDQFMSELGFEYTQDAYDAYQVYKDSKGQLALLKNELKAVKGETFSDYSPQQIDKINALLQRAVNTAEELKAKVSKFIPAGTGGRSISITPDGKSRFNRNRPGIPETKITKTENFLLRKQIIDEARGSKVGFREGAKLTKAEVTARLKEAHKKFLDGKVVKSEYDMLKKQIRDQARGAKAGYKAGVQITREQIVDQFRQSEAKINTLRDLVSTYIQDKLPVEARGKFLQALAGDITTRRAFSLFDRADRVVMNIEKAKLIADIKDLRLPKMGDSHVAVDYQKRLIEAFKGLDLAKPSQATIVRLKSLQSYLERNKEALQIHPELINRVERLSKLSIRDMSNADLRDLRDTIEHLQNLGRLKLELKNKYNARVRKANLDKLVNSSTNRDPHFKDPRNPTLFERRRLDTIRAYMSTLHTPRVADYIDDFKAYMGENAKMTKRVAVAETTAQNNSKAIITKALEEIQHLGVAELSEESQRNISIELLTKQGATDQVNTLLKKFGLETAPELSATEQKIADIVRKSVGQFTKEIGAVYEEIENLPFRAVENYFPIKYEKEAHIVPSETINQTRHRTTKTEQGFTKSRVKGVERIPRTDFLAVFDEAVKDQQWYLNIQPELENMKYLVKSQEYLDKAGELASNFWRDYLDVVSRRGWAATAQSNQFLRETRIKLNEAILGYKVSTIMLQPLAVFDGLAMTQARYGAKASAEMFKEFMKAWFVPGYSKKIIEGSPALQFRSGGEVAIMENMESFVNLKGAYNTFKKGALSLIQKGDVKTAAGVQQGIENVLKKNGVANARQEAEFLMNLMQGSAEVAYRPLILSKGEGMRTWFTFQTFALNRWGIIANDLFRGGVMKPGAMVKLNALIGLMILVAGGIAENEARKGVKKVLTGSTYGNRSALSIALGVIPENVPFFGSLISSLLATGDPSADSPIMGALTDLFSGAYQLVTGQGGKFPATTAKAINKNRIYGGILFTRAILSAVFGVPGTIQATDLLKRAVLPPTPPKGKYKVAPLDGGTSGFPKLDSSSGGFPKLQ